ncbi:MAG: hypothetical protein AAGA93_24515 [Actinomycetota bacterium]
MARHTPTDLVQTGNDSTNRTRATTCLWRDAFGPGYAVGPSGRLVDYVCRASDAGSAC